MRRKVKRKDKTKTHLQGAAVGHHWCPEASAANLTSAPDVRHLATPLKDTHPTHANAIQYIQQLHFLKLESLDSKFLLCFDNKTLFN